MPRTTPTPRCPTPDNDAPALARADVGLGIGAGTDVAIPLAAGALAWAGFTLPPAVGAVLMSMSNIVVALNAQLLRRLDLPERPSVTEAGGNWEA